MSEFLKGKISIDEFINHHTKTFVSYCEIIIYPDGDIEYCIPSHIETLIRVTNKSKEQLKEIINPYSDLIIELCNLTGCVSVWFDFYIAPTNFSLTSYQINSLNKLKESKCIYKDCSLLNSK